MGSRYYDYELPCGCMISTDSGGGLIPCDLGLGLTDDGEDRELTQEEKDQQALHQKCWAEYRDSDDFKRHENEIKAKNK